MDYGVIDKIETYLAKIASAQEIANFIALANSPEVPEDIRRAALNRATQLLGLQQSRAAEQFNNDALPTDLIR